MLAFFFSFFLFPHFWSMKIQKHRKILSFSLTFDQPKVVSLCFAFQMWLPWKICSFCFYLSEIKFSEIILVLNWQAQKPTENLEWQKVSQHEAVIPSLIFICSSNTWGCHLPVSCMVTDSNRSEALLFVNVKIYRTEDGWQETWHFSTHLAFVSPFPWFFWVQY